MSKLTEGLTKEELKWIRKFCWRDLQCSMTYNHVRQMGHGCMHALRTYIEYLWPGEENKEKRVEAYLRESVFYNITPYINTWGIGLFASMEKEYKENPDTFDPNTINAIKIAIMGPLAGIGDSIFWVTLRVIVSSIAIPFGLQGSILCPIMFLGIFFIPHFIAYYFGCIISYKLGTNFVESAFESGIMEQVTHAASIMGIMMIGAMIARTVDVPLKGGIVTGQDPETGKDVIMTYKSMFDSIVPGIMGLGVTWGCFQLIRKKVSPNLIMAGIFVIAILGAWAGIF